MSHILPSPSHVHNSPPSLLDERPRHPTPLGPPPVQCHCFFHHPGPRLHPLDHDPTHLVYLLDHSCYLPPQHLRVLFGQFMDHSTLIGNFLPSSFDFQRKILLCFGLCEHTYVPQAMHSIPTRPFKATAREEAEQVMFGALDNLFSNTNDKLKDIRVLVINSSLFNPTPSLSAMMVNKYKLCDNIKSFNLGDMGYGTGVIIVDLVKDMLQFHCNTNAAIVSIDNITQNWYPSFMYDKFVPMTHFWRVNQRWSGQMSKSRFVATVTRSPSTSTRAVGEKRSPAFVDHDPAPSLYKLKTSSLTPTRMQFG
ncbi:hypothetical protein JHK85_040689 [Glycine max]|nr:hypothetical protein JHK85_040689 [Glycine max]